MSIISKESVVQLFCTDMIVSGQTLFEGETKNLPNDISTNLLKDDILFHRIDLLEKSLVSNICEIIKNAVGDDDVLIPISGGVDSRILLLCAAHVLKTKRIHCVTYGAYQGNLEHKYATAVCRSLGLDPPEFHLLDGSIYQDYIPIMLKKTLGRVSAYHCHLLSYLEGKNYTLPNKILSGFYADAVCGYAQGPEVERWEHSYWYKGVLRKADCLGFELEDLKSIQEVLKEKWDFYKSQELVRSFDEYLYINLRSRFLLGALKDAYESCGKQIITPWSNALVASIALNAPRSYRKGKVGFRQCIAKFNSKLGSIPYYSSIEIKTFRGLFQKYERLFVTLLEWILDSTSNDSLDTRKINPWMNEIHGRVIRKELQEKMRFDSSEIVSSGLLSKKIVDRVAKRHYRSFWHQAQFHLLALGEALRYQKSIIKSK